MTVFRGPASYTGEDTAEVSCHGGVYITRMTLRSALSHGAVPADPGEFTKRAFLNGKISLTQAEAVMQLISAGGENSAKAAFSLLEGSLSSRLARLREKLTDTAAHISAWIDFPEEDVDEVEPGKLENVLDSVRQELDDLVGRFEVEAGRRGDLHRLEGRERGCRGALPKSASGLPSGAAEGIRFPGGLGDLLPGI